MKIKDLSNLLHIKKKILLLQDFCAPNNFLGTENWNFWIFGYLKRAAYYVKVTQCLFKLNSIGLNNIRIRQ